VAITCLQYFFTSGDNAVIGRGAVGLVLVVVILFLPSGLLGLIADRRRARLIEAAAGVAPAAAAAPMPAIDMPARPAAGADAALLRVRSLSKSFKGIHALSDVSFEVRRGEILGLIGPNGSGKSTFINMVSGHYRPAGGEIIFEGRDLAGLDAHHFSRAGIARTYQIPRPFGHMTVQENVALVAMYGGRGLGRSQAMGEARGFLAFTGLGDRAELLPDSLNLHQRKFLELARALAARPKLLLLDEVLSGLTPSEINEAIAMIRRIRDQGTTIVFVEHVMRAVMALADRIVVLNHGALIAEGGADAVMADAAVKAAYLGASHA